MNDKKREALEIAIGQIDKQFGKGAIMRLGEARGAVQIEAIPTGSLALDIASEWAAYLGAASSRYTEPSPLASPLWLTTSWQRRRDWAAPRRT